MLPTQTVIRSSGNVFADLGFDSVEAEHLRIRSELMAVLQTIISTRDLYPESCGRSSRGLATAR